MQVAEQKCGVGSDVTKRQPQMGHDWVTILILEFYLVLTTTKAKFGTVAVPVPSFPPSFNCRTVNNYPEWNRDEYLHSHLSHRSTCPEPSHSTQVSDYLSQQF